MSYIGQLLGAVSQALYGEIRSGYKNNEIRLEGQFEKNDI
jgi:hypothetical protein